MDVFYDGGDGRQTLPSIPVGLRSASSPDTSVAKAIMTVSMSSLCIKIHKQDPDFDTE